MKSSKKGLFLLALTLLAAELFAQEISISPNDKSVTISKDKIIFSPKKEGCEYIISGNFTGQLINKTKNTVLKLNNARIENRQGEAAIYGEAKTEISTVAGSTNHVISSGKSGEKSAAIFCRKNLELGGSGSLYVTGNVYHAVKADDVKLKGSGKFYLQGTKEGSAINCKNCISEKGKTFTAFLMNSKNGIKADQTIVLESGTFCFKDNKTALKTDTKKDDPKNPHSITLSGGTIQLNGNENFYKTEEKSFSVKGAKITEN